MLGPYATDAGGTYAAKLALST
ncbi:hypothetical protein CUJ84_pRLN1000238 (plasmid) [Rhizobium leguminosarum]|uniref:Uncharacterized protein n=1 Tax=Rhizobium leguminosarum TaxID=384 RepID=A0A2K9ZBS9_RHILE|nr:hypothetical protein CUJ84_pRLN1000238 [Rhizobium leguminosarum]